MERKEKRDAAQAAADSEAFDGVRRICPNGEDRGAPCEDAEEPTAMRGFSPYVIEQTRAAAAYLRRHTEGRDTIAELSRRFGLSQTVLKECFRAVCGESIAAFSRRARMQRAAELLRETDENVLEVAMRVGYSNASKFAGAFRSVMGSTPREYRRKMSANASRRDSEAP